METPSSEFLFTAMNNYTFGLPMQPKVFWVVSRGALLTSMYSYSAFGISGLQGLERGCSKVVKPDCRSAFTAAIEEKNMSASLIVRFEAGNLFIQFGALNLNSIGEAKAIIAAGPKIVIRDGWLYMECLGCLLTHGDGDATVDECGRWPSDAKGGIWMIYSTSRLVSRRFCL